MPGEGHGPVALPQVIDWHAHGAKARFAESLRNTGFAVVSVGNGYMGIRREALDVAMRENIAFFENASFAEKKASLFLDDRLKDAGWFPLGAEGRTDGAANLVEYVHHRPDMRGRHFAGRDFSATWGCYEAVRELMLEMTEVLCDHLPTGPMDYLRQRIDDRDRSLVRCLKYFGHHPKDPKVLPAWDEHGLLRLWNDPHEDACWLTLIPTQTKPGLQLLGRDGQWYDVPWVADDQRQSGRVVFVVNSGDALSVASSGAYGLCKSVTRADGTVDKTGDVLRVEDCDDPSLEVAKWRAGVAHTDRKLRVVRQGIYPSTTHRVKAGEGVRYSMPFFFHLEADAPLGPWHAGDKMRSYALNKEAQRAEAMARIEQNYAV